MRFPQLALILVALNDINWLIRKTISLLSRWSRLRPP
jgi:hypothetical protein